MTDEQGKYDPNEYQRNYMARRRESAQEIGKIPPIVDLIRRRDCLADFELFCKTYHAAEFSKPWAGYHKETAARIQGCVDYGGWYARALPRGGGKTTLCCVGVEWAALRGTHLYPTIFGASETLGVRLLKGIKTQLLTNDLLLQDFPHAIWPIRVLGNEARRASGQKYKGTPTFIEWGQNRISLPWINDDASLSNGVVIEAFGITSALRGLKYTRPDGKSVRPDIGLVDDPQTREALDIATPIPTPRGFVSMGDLQIGDTVFDESGRRCTVIGASDVYVGRECYRVFFDDGSSVVADGGHLWATSTALQRTNARRRVIHSHGRVGPQYEQKPLSSVVTTDELRETLYGEGGRSNHSIDIIGDIDCSTANLPIPPYTLGAWLGDGSRSGATVTTADPQIIQEIAGDGFAVSSSHAKPNNRARSYYLRGLRKLLIAAGLLGSKHVPDAYLFAHSRQRLALLQGLMDTDGWITNPKKGVKGSRCCFSNTNRRIVDAVLFLCRSLGIKAKCASVKPKNATALPSWVISFITTVQVFRLKRKQDRLPPTTKSQTLRRYITAVERVESRPVRCIAVSSPSRQYLCGHALVATHNSAKSPSQSQTRMEIMTGDIAYLAGPGAKMPVFCPCTVIYEGDLADQLLDRDKHPEWQGQRTKMLESMPKNLDKWDEYADKMRTVLREGGKIETVNNFYKRNRKSMDEGAKVSWEHRHNEDELSAIQHAMNLRIRDEAAFYAECQNEPIIAQDDLELLPVEQIARKVTNYTRGVVPDECSIITAFTDVQKDHLFWMVAAFAPDFTGYIIDYGAWPEQKANYFTRKGIRRKLSNVYAGDEAGVMFGALTALGDRLCGSTYATQNGREMRLARWCIDGNWRARTAAVEAYAKQSKYANQITITQGRGVKAVENPFSQAMRAKKWRTHMLNWFWQDGPGPARWVTFDTNFWKKRIHEALSLSIGSRGGVQLFKAAPQVHRMLADHLRAEKPTRVEAHGRTVYEFSEIPGRDNEGLDCLVGCFVAASIAGVSRTTERIVVAKPKKRQKVKYL